MAGTASVNATGPLVARPHIALSVVFEADNKGNGTLVLRDGGALGTQRLGLRALLGQTVRIKYGKGVHFHANSHATIANGVVWVEYR